MQRPRDPGLFNKFYLTAQRILGHRYSDGVMGWRVWDGPETLPVDCGGGC